MARRHLTNWVHSGGGWVLHTAAPSHIGFVNCEAPLSNYWSKYERPKPKLPNYRLRMSGLKPALLNYRLKNHRLEAILSFDRLKMRAAADIVELSSQFSDDGCQSFGFTVNYTAASSSVSCEGIYSGVNPTYSLTPPIRIPPSAIRSLCTCIFFPFT